MISKDMTIKEIIAISDKFIAVFANNGLKGLENKMLLDKVGEMKLEQVLKMKEIDVASFINLLESTLDNVRVEDSINNKNKDGISIKGLLPCPVRIQIMEMLEKKMNIKDFNIELKAASEGLDFLKNDVLESINENDLSDVYISAGFDLFFDKSLILKYKENGVFKDLTNFPSINKDFKNDQIDALDPTNSYSVISGVPAVFLINTKVLGDLPAPRTWKDLLNPIYKGKISLPISDFDLFNAILLHMYKEFGLEGITKLGESLVSSMHPAQMVKSEQKTKKVQPAINIMPYFFTKMAIEGGVMKAIWPEDGAILSPIFLLTKSKMEEQLKPIAEVFSSREFGEILSHQGLFPSVHGEIDNKLGENKFKWVGWDFINNNDIASLLDKCEDAFNKGLNV